MGETDYTQVLKLTEAQFNMRYNENWGSPECITKEYDLQDRQRS